MSTHQAHDANGFEELLRLPGMDPKRLRTLVARLRVRSRGELKRALAAGRAAGLEGFSRELKSRLQAALADDSGASAADPAPSSAHPVTRNRSLAAGGRSAQGSSRGAHGAKDRR